MILIYFFGWFVLEAFQLKNEENFKGILFIHGAGVLKYQ